MMVCADRNMPPLLPKTYMTFGAGPPFIFLIITD